MQLASGRENFIHRFDFWKLIRICSLLRQERPKRKRRKEEEHFFLSENSHVSATFIVPDSLVRRFAIRLANKLGCVARARSPLCVSFFRDYLHNTRQLLLPFPFDYWSGRFQNLSRNLYGRHCFISLSYLWIFTARFSNYRFNVPNVSSKYLGSINSSYYNRLYFPRPLYRSVQWNSFVTHVPVPHLGEFTKTSPSGRERAEVEDREDGWRREGGWDLQKARIKSTPSVPRGPSGRLKRRLIKSLAPN